MAISYKRVQVSYKTALKLAYFGTTEDFEKLYNGETVTLSTTFNVDIDETIEKPTIYYTPTRNLILNRTAYEETVVFTNGGEHFEMHKDIDVTQYDELVFSLQGNNTNVLLNVDIYKHETLGYSMKLSYNTDVYAPTLYGRKSNGAIDTIVNGSWNLWTQTAKTIPYRFSSGYTSSINMNASNCIIGTGDPIYTTASPNIKTKYKIFWTRNGALDYLSTGDDYDDITKSDELAEDREVTLYYESDIFSRSYNSATSTHNGASAIHFRVQYKNNKGEEIVNPYRAICGYVANNNVPNDSNRFGNIVWIANRNINIIETKQHPVHGTIAPSKTIPNYNNTTGFYPPYIDGNTIYDARYRTNMRIFANEQDAIEFLGGGNPTPIGESGNDFNPSGFIGDKTVFNDGHDMAGGGMSSCWIMNESQLQDLANVFTTGLTTVEEQNGGVIINVTKTCARAFASHGEPIDAVVDLFWLPFDPSEFVTSGRTSFQIGRDDLASATSLIKLLTQSGDTVIAHGNRSIGKSNEFVGNVVGSIGDMFENTTQKVKNVSE